MIFVVGSTTQSRLFYIVIAFIFLLNLFIDRASQISRILKSVTFLVLLFLYYYLLVIHASKDFISDLQSFSGRTGIWNIVLENWSDRGMIFGYQGQYTLADYSANNSGRSIFFNAHNLVLQYLWDWGLTGLLLALIFLFFSFQISQLLNGSGYLLSTAIVTAGLIEITLPNSLLAPKFAFILLFVKHIESIKKPFKDAKPES
jgi:hypothetical protein